MNPSQAFITNHFHLLLSRLQILHTVLIFASALVSPRPVKTAGPLWVLLRESYWLFLKWSKVLAPLCKVLNVTYVMIWGSMNKTEMNWAFKCHSNISGWKKCEIKKGGRWRNESKLVSGYQWRKFSTLVGFICTAKQSQSVSEERPENLPGSNLQIWPTVVENRLLWTCLIYSIDKRIILYGQNSRCDGTFHALYNNPTPDVIG